MFTPQRKVWSGWSLTPRTEPAQKNGSGSGSGHNLNGVITAEGKDIVLDESTPPHPKDLLENNGETMNLTEKLSKLENELFEYQYNMGLLLIEKKEWTSKYEELQQAFTETKDSLKREQAAHLISMSEVEKREENLRKALGVEKQCVLDLEKALREMRSEYAEIKFTSDSKLAEANALITSIEEKSLEVESRLHAADAKHAEVSRKSSEIERKSHEVEVRENVLRRERLSFNAEREAHTGNISNQREDLREWERKLQEGEERLAEVRRLLNQREERANENDRIYQQKQIDLKGAQKKIEIVNSSLKKKEDDISSRVEKLSLKEKEVDSMRKSLEMKEKELLELEEKLNAREQVEIQKLLEEHNTILEVKKHDFELEMDRKRKDLEYELKSKVAEVEKKEAEVNHMEAKVAKREQALDKKLEKLKEKEKDFESKLKDLKDREKSVRIEEKKMEHERKQILSDKEDLLSLKVEIEKTKADIEERRLRLNEESERLKLTEEERSEHVRLQSELKQEIGKGRLQRELLLKEGEDLKQEKERFEKEWEDLDEKRAEIKKELEYVTVQKENLEKLKRSEEERLNDEMLETQSYVQRELEALKLAKDSFAANMEHEKSVMAEKIQSEKNQIINDFELWKREVETKLLNEKEDMENGLREREKLFDEEREKELNNINYLREVVGREMEEMKLERSRIEKEKQEISTNQKHLDGQQLEMRKDIDELVGLSRKLKEQREQFFEERDRFITFVENHKSCKNCGELTSEFVLSDLQSLAELDDMNAPPLPRLAEDYLKEALQGTPDRTIRETSPGAVNLGSPASGGSMSWLRKCTSKIFIFSAGKKNELAATGQNLPRKHVHVESSPKRLLNTEEESKLRFGVAADALDAQNIQSNDSIKEVGSGLDPSVDEHSNINSKAPDDVEDSHHSDLRAGPRKPGKRGRGKVNRTRSVKAVVADAKAILGDAVELDENDHSNGIPSVYTNESRGDSSLVDKGVTRNGRKRNRLRPSRSAASEIDADYSEGHSDSVTAGGRRKRRQKVVPAVQTPSGKRYNLRRPKSAAPIAANGALPDPNKGKAKDIDDGGGRRGEIAGEDDGSTHLMQVKTLKSIEDVNEFSSAGVHGTKVAGVSQDGDGDTANQLVDDMVLSEEVNGTPEGTREYENQEHRSGSHGEDDGDDDEAEHPGEVSISKKFWTFLTT